MIRMRPNLTLVTLGVADLQKSLAFYRDGLGWTCQQPDENVAFFPLRGIVLGLYPRHLLAEDAKVPEAGSGFGGITLAYNAISEKEVDQVLDEAHRAGATITKKAQKVFWGGYNGYFSDPDGHLWEVAFNPHWKLNEDGTVQLS